MAQAPLRNFVNGKYTDPHDGAYSDVVDPSTGEAYTQAPVSGAADVDEALHVAAAAFETWRDATPADRSRMLLRFADAIELRAEDFISAEGRNTGKPLWTKIAAEKLPHEGTHETHSYAGGSPTTDGTFLYVSFGSFGTYCYDLDGKPRSGSHRKRGNSFM